MFFLLTIISTAPLTLKLMTIVLIHAGMIVAPTKVTTGLTGMAPVLMLLTVLPTVSTFILFPILSPITLFLSLTTGSLILFFFSSFPSFFFLPSVITLVQSSPRELRKQRRPLNKYSFFSLISLSFFLYTFLLV